MKKKITILFIALLASVGTYGAPHTTSCDNNCGLHEWNEYTGEKNWTTAYEHLSKSGKIQTLNFTTTSSSTTTGSISVKISGTFYRCQTYNNAYRYWYIAQFNVFNITYEVQQLISGNWTTIGTLEDLNHKYSDTVDDSKKGNAGHYYSYIINKLETFSADVNCNLKIQATETSYKVRVKVTIVPSNVSASENTANVNLHYLSTNYYSKNCGLNNARTSYNNIDLDLERQLTFTYNKGSHSIVANNTAVNPLVGGYYLIYNKPNAKLSISLKTDAQATKTISGTTYYGNSAFIKKVSDESSYSVIGNIIKLYNTSTQGNNIFYTQEYSLTQLKTSSAGKTISISHRLAYNSSKNVTYGNDAMLGNTGNYLLQSNTVNYKVAPTVEFPAFTTDEKKTIYKCYSSTNKDEINYVAGFQSKTIQTTSSQGIDVSAYKPEYVWEYSYDETTWNTIEDKYKCGSIITGLNGDLKIRSTILQNNNVVYIRQKAILKAFSHTLKSDLYTEYDSDKKCYYIAVISDYYTYKKLPNPTQNNFRITSGSSYVSEDANSVFVGNSPYNGKQISFNFVTGTLGTEAASALSKISSSTITITKNDGTQEVINSSFYSINDYKKGEWKFDCKIEFCSGTSIGKSFTINSYPEIYFAENDRVKETYKIYSEEKIDNDEKYIISLQSDVVTTTNPNLTSEDLKSQYSWEFSYDKNNWKQIDATYIVNPIAIDNGDTHISSSLLGNYDVVYLRQKVVLKAFSKNTKDAQFSELIDGKYYLASTSDIYTINKLSNITEDNIQFTSGAGYASEDMRTCFDDAANIYNGLQIEFDIIGDANLTKEELEALRDNAKYSIKRTKITWEGKETTEDVTKSRTPNKHTVSGFNSEVKALIFTCEVESNNQTFNKTIKLESYPKEEISMDKISTPTKGATITNIDGAQMAVYAMCPKGEEFKIKYFLDKDADRVKLEQYWARIKYEYPAYPEMVEYKDVVPFIPYSEIEPEPVFVPTDYSALTIFDLYAILQKDADLVARIEAYYKVTIDRVAESQIESFLADEEQEAYQTELAEYRLREVAHIDAYNAAEQEYIADYNAKRDAYNAEWEQKVGWKEFKEPDFYTTTLENITENDKEAEFLICTQTKAGGCFSNSVTIKVTYFDGITNNTIAFVDDNIKDKQEIIVTAGEGNPYIKGELAKGAYGIPYIEGNCTYTYVWKYFNTKTSTWEVLTDAEGNVFQYTEKDEKTGSRPSVGTQFISLNAGTIADISAMFPNGVEISRFVYSQRGNETNSKLEHQSNVLKITSAKPIAEDTFDYSLDEKFCPGNGNVYVTFKDVELNANEVLNVVCKSTEELPMMFDYEQRVITIANPTKDFSVSINRVDTITNVRSNAIVLDIEVPRFKANFSVYVDYTEHSLDEDRINVQSGSRVVLLNNTINEMGTTVYNWTLQVQKDDYRGQSSEKKEPVCYLYNPGINKIILEATTANKCKSTVVADNIFVVNAEGRNLPVSSYFEENMDQMLASEATISVYPTILNNEDMVNIKSNIEQYDVIISDVAGKVMLNAENLSMSSTLDVAHLPNGVYILNAANKSFKLIKK